MNFFKKPDYDNSRMTAYRSKNDKTLLGLFNLDFYRGKKDGRKSPLAGQPSIDLIQSEELLDRNETRNGIHQNIGERKKRLEHNATMQNDNHKQTEDLDRIGGLLPEPVAQSLYSSARSMIILSVIMMIVEVCGLFSIARSTLGNNFFAALAVAVLISSAIAIGVHLFLDKLSPERSKSFRIGLIVVGCLMSITGLVGLVMLRAETFSGSLTGGEMNFQQIGLANLLLMTGLTLGVPLIAGSLFDDAMNKLHRSRNSLNLYIEKNRLLKEKGEMESTVQVLEEFDRRLDSICEKIIASRQGRYVRGFHRGATKNPEAITKFKLSESCNA